MKLKKNNNFMVICLNKIIYNLIKKLKKKMNDFIYFMEFKLKIFYVFLLNE